MYEYVISRRLIFVLGVWGVGILGMMVLLVLLLVK